MLGADKSQRKETYTSVKRDFTNFLKWNLLTQ